VIDIDKMMDIFIETQIRIKKWYKLQEEEHTIHESPLKIEKIVKEVNIDMSGEKMRPE
jgi:hypothetical protein